MIYSARGRGGNATGAERDDHDDSSGGKHTLNATLLLPVKAGQFPYPRKQGYAPKV